MANELAISLELPLSFTNSVLSKFSGVNIDLYTINFARLVFEEFKVSVQGQRSYNTALNNLPVHLTPDGNLTIGWALTQLLRSSGVHLYNYEHLMFASALGECFSEDYAAFVIYLLGKKHEARVEITPHISEYRALVHASNGVLSTVDFGLVVDDRIRLNPYNETHNHRPAPGSGLPQPQEVAEALQALADVSNGTRKDVSFFGGDVLGWIAAAAEWLLGLEVTIYDKDGKELYSSMPGCPTHIKITFIPPSVTTDDVLAQNFAGALRLTEPPHRKTGPIISPLPFTGRIDFQSLLPKAFGMSFHRLDHEEAKVMGNALGGTARALELLATTNEVEDLSSVISAQNKANPASWGTGLIETITNWFPELRRLQGRMERAQKLSFEDADKQCSDSIKRLEQICGCNVCSNQTTEGSHEGPASGLCLAIMLETILALGLTLSRITVASALYPSRAGILAIYHSQVAKRVQSYKFLLDESSRHKTLFGNEWNASYSRRLQTCVTIFAGSWPKTDLQDNLVGLSHEGICAWVSVLRKNEGSPSAPADDLIRVTSGGLNWKQKVFTRVCLGPPTPNADPYEWEDVKVQHLQESLYCK